MNIIFLDVDGVLNSKAYFETVKEKNLMYAALDEGKIPLLKRIVKDNKAAIVLSSTWKTLNNPKEPEAYKMWSYLLSTLAKYDIEIISTTPNLAKKRPEEIKAWLDDWTGEKIKWISIEDDYSEKDYAACGIGGHLIQTVFFTDKVSEGGLQEKHVGIARQLFLKQ